MCVYVREHVCKQGHSEQIEIILFGILFSLSKSHSSNREKLTNLKSIDHHCLDRFESCDVLIKQQEV